MDKEGKIKLVRILLNSPYLHFILQGVVVNSDKYTGNVHIHW